MSQMKMRNYASKWWGQNWLFDERIAVACLHFSLPGLHGLPRLNGSQSSWEKLDIFKLIRKQNAFE